MTSAFALILIVIPFLAVTVYATLRHTKIMADSSAGSRHLRMFRFLFFRFNPESYWYGLVSLFRGVIICLIPIIFRDLAAMQIIVMTTILSGFSLLPVYLKPWRAALANLVDGIVMVLMNMILLIVAMSTDYADVTELIGTIGAIFFIAAFVVLLVAMLYSAWRRFQPNPCYDYWALEGSLAGLSVRRHSALELVHGLDFSRKLMCGAGPGDLGGSRGPDSADNPGKTGPKISGQTAFKYPGLSD